MRRRRGLGGQEGQVARPQPLAHLAYPCASTACPSWDSDRGRPDGPCQVRTARKATPHAPTASARSPSVILASSRRRPRRAAASDASGSGVGHGLPTKVIDVTFTGDASPRTATRVEVGGRPADRARASPPTPRRDPRALLPRAGVRVRPGHDAPSTLKPIDSPGIVDGRVAHAREDPSSSLEVAVTGVTPAGLLLAARHRRGQGPADLRPSWRSPAPVAALAVSFVVLARRLAQRRGTTRPPAGGPPRPGWRGSSTPPPAGCAARGWSACSAFCYLVAGRGPRQGPADQPDLRHLLRAGSWVGLVVASLLFGPVWKAISPVRTINAGLRPALRRRPGRRRLHLPRAAGLLAGRGRAVRVRLDGAGLPPRRRARPGPAVVRGLRRADDPRRRAVREPFYERADPFEVYSTLVAQLSVWGRRDDAAGGPQPAGQPRHHRGRPGLVAVVSVLFGSTAFDSFKRLDARG